MFEIVLLVADLWVAVIMAGLLWFWLCDFDVSRWQEWCLSCFALPPVALTLWRATVEIAALGSSWLHLAAG